MLRTHTCGELRKEHIGQTVQLAGWVKKIRELGAVTFIDLVDRYGLVQLFFDGNSFSPDEYKKVKALNVEDVIQVEKGIVRPRPEGNVNTSLPTGEIEVRVESWKLLNKSKVPPFEIKNDADVSEELRLKYRYLDLRRPFMQENIVFRHKVAQEVRQFLSSMDFVEIETPYLMKSTPEGARDFLVPSRLHPGKFYALPQSPQTYKQLLMVSGFDRYFQIVKCFRDEDLRKDRQPEFTQIDIEMSFVERNDVLNIAEKLTAHVLEKFLNIKIDLPLERLPFDTAMEKYGSDKPDRRFGMEIIPVHDVFQHSEFNVFKSLIKENGFVGALFLDDQVLSRKQIDNYTEFVKKYGASGLAFVKWQNGTFGGGISKFILNTDAENILRSKLGDGANAGTFLFIGTPDKLKSLEILGALRLQLGNDFNLINKEKHDLFWVVDFPLFEWSEEEKRYVSRHHPFTSPKPEHREWLKTSPGKVLSNAYDLVWNGNEIAGGSIRIHDRQLQKEIFDLLGLSEEEAKLKFGFLMEAFQYGAPPHGGIAFGFDRLIMLMRNLESIRDVIPFPKTTSALSLMDGAPSEVDERQLMELHLKVIK
jgi:aspartyl-tRNA synthetase